MRAVIIEDGRIVVGELPDPEPGSGELLVRVGAAGLNGADMMQRAGRYPPPPGAPDTPGLELAGEVVARGPGATRFAQGDRVMAVVAGGGQAELALVHERIAMPVPERLSLVEAGGVPEVFTTAHDALFAGAGLRSGERLLVHGAAGGVGSAAVQLGRAAGARVTATVRREEHREAVADLGADRVLAPEGFAAHGPWDVILELVGAPNLPDDVEALATLGRIAVIGIGAGARAEVDLQALMRRRGRIHGSTLRTRPLEGKALAARAMEAEVLPHLAAGTIRVPVAATFPLERAAEAYERFAEGGKLGKIVLTMDQ
jgi:putative PIG3 family NAD(P)H quinone oxidoreductase